MYGLIGKVRALPGKRAELLEVLKTGGGGMPGCVSYVIAEDVSEADVLWVTEVWDSEEAHDASIDIPKVREAIEAGRPLIEAFEMHQRTRPVVAS